jgi:tRNA-dihydrouridine synthase
MYRSEVRYAEIARAVRAVPCPVIANGNVTSANAAVRILAETGAAGLMVGRHAIRNPWIFRQIRQKLAGEPVFAPTLRDVHAYVTDLFASTRHEGIPELAHVNKMKKYLNFVGQSVDPEGAFLHAMRRTASAEQLFAVCDEHLLARGDTAFADEPYAGVVARPNCETPDADGCSLESVTA